MSGVVRRIANNGKLSTDTAVATHDVVIVGGGAGGVAVASSLLARDASLDIAIIDPADVHYYQPGWTLVGAGVFDPRQTRKDMGAVIPKGVKWIKAAVAAFEPKDDAVVLEGCHVVKYKHLIVAPGLKLDWRAVDGLEETLGRNGVTSNYRYDLAPYTWELVKELRAGKAVFTQPPMPIKCAGAPQKVMYLSADHWRGPGVLTSIDVDFYNAGAGALRRRRLRADADALRRALQHPPQLQAQPRRHRRPGEEGLVQRRPATTARARPSRSTFDMIHVCPPQTAPDFIRVSPLANAAGWVDVDQQTLRHKTYANIYSLGDVMSAPNAKTVAAARKQAPVVAENLLMDRAGKSQRPPRDLRRLRLLPADCRERQDRAGRVRLWRQATAELPDLADQGHRAVAARLVPQGAHAAADLLAGNAQGPRDPGQARIPELTTSLLGPCVTDHG